MTRPCLASIAVSLALASLAPAQVERIWLTYRTNDPSKIVVNWTTKTPGDSKVSFGPTKDHGKELRVAENVTLHHVEIPAAKKDAEVHYSVSSPLKSTAFRTTSIGRQPK